MVWIQSIDTKILLFIQEHFRMESLNGFWKGITHLGDGGIFWIVLTVLMIVFGLLLQKRIPTFLTIRKAGVASALSMMIGALVTNVWLKKWVARIRPYDAVAEIVPLIGRQVDYSFPSGHTCASFACALVLYRILPKPYGVPAVILATLIAFSRMYVGVHYPTDILGGFLVALVSSSLAYCLVEGRKKTSVS
ncbi:MAG: phosphatase PAP2 family protein [Lachnospiraceae bacterium]|nr:phosphatase PAP2 family protein [Lachnospiraceae bacterium]